MSHIGKNIKKFRLLNQMTQKQLGEAIGVPEQTVSMWERGRVPNQQYIEKLKEVLLISDFDIYASSDDNGTLSKCMIKFSQLPEASKYKVMAMVAEEWEKAHGKVEP